MPVRLLGAGSEPQIAEEEIHRGRDRRPSALLVQGKRSPVHASCPSIGRAPWRCRMLQQTLPSPDLPDSAGAGHRVYVHSSTLRYAYSAASAANLRTATYRRYRSIRPAVSAWNWPFETIRVTPAVLAARRLSTSTWGPKASVGTRSPLGRDSTSWITFQETVLFMSMMPIATMCGWSRSASTN